MGLPIFERGACLNEIKDTKYEPQNVLGLITVGAIEGTEAMKERVGQLCKSGGWTLVEVSKPQQDMRFDVPCVGPDTIRSLKKNGGKYLVVEADKTIIIDKPGTIKLADQLGVAVLGR